MEEVLKKTLLLLQIEEANEFSSSLYNSVV